MGYVTRSHKFIFDNDTIYNKLYYSRCICGIESEFMLILSKLMPQLKLDIHTDLSRQNEPVYAYYRYGGIHVFD